MINTIKHRMGKDNEEGFTLIELMVVVLILGILMAIAIPTFLSLTSSAKTNAAESDLTTATQDEAVYFTQNGNYGALTEGSNTYTSLGAANLANMKAIDSGLNWTTTALTAATAGTKTVLIDVISGSQIILGTAASNGNFYWVADNSGTLSYDYNSTATAPTTFPTTWGNSWGTITNS